MPPLALAGFHELTRPVRRRWPPQVAFPAPGWLRLAVPACADGHSAEQTSLERVTDAHIDRRVLTRVRDAQKGGPDGHRRRALCCVRAGAPGAKRDSHRA